VLHLSLLILLTIQNLINEVLHLIWYQRKCINLLLLNMYITQSPSRNKIRYNNTISLFYDEIEYVHRVVSKSEEMVQADTVQKLTTITVQIKE
jgi:hypothetical protein